MRLRAGAEAGAEGGLIGLRAGAEGGVMGFRPGAGTDPAGPRAR
jgi:hypothetical protein